MAQLRFACAELPKHFRNGACLKAVSQQLVELLAPGMNFEDSAAVVKPMGTSFPAASFIFATLASPSPLILLS